MVSRMKITNIANNRDKQGYFYSSEHYHPTTHHLAVEPWLCGYCLKLDSEIEIPNHSYFAEKDYMDALKANRIIDFEIPSEPQKEVVVEQKTAQEKVTEKVIQLEDELTTEEKQTLTENLQKFADTTSAFAQLVVEVSKEVKVEEVKEEVQEKEPAKKPIKPYSFQKGKK